MKNRILVVLAALLYIAVGYAGNISIDGIILKPGETKPLMISLASGASSHVGVQFDLTLPEGFSLEKNGDALYTISTNQASDMTCNVQDLGNHSFRFILYSNSLQNLKAGEFLSVNLKANSNISLASYTVSLSDIAFSDSNGNVTKESGTQATVKVTNFFTLLYKVDGETYKSYEIEYGATITPEPAPTKEGYTFSGWSDIPTTMPAHDVTVTGTFTINKYKLTYKVDGEVYKSYDVEYGATITPEPDPTKEGYSFSGWSEIPATMPAHDVTVTGSFTKGTYKLIYVVDGETYKTISYDYGATITPEPAPTKEGYTFSGWSEIPATMPAHDVTVTGTFTINKYKLTYKIDGEVYKSYDVEYGTKITPEPDPTKEGYSFSGWSDIPNTMPAHDVTVTGTFTINKYKLTYKVDGEVYKSYDVEYGAKITPEPAPIKEGYTFSGWSDIPTTMPAHDVTITGSFTINKYKLTYMVDGEVYKSYDVEFGATITPEPAPTKEGYSFSGWSEIPKTMPAHDVTVTGTFTKGAYKLTYVVDGEIYKTISYDYGAKITPEPAPTKEGYTFSGWSEIPETMPAHDVTITGLFTINKYKLTYMVDGEVYKLYDVEYGANITPEPAPTKEGYSFSGWSDIPSTMPAYDVTVTGTFTKDGIVVDGVTFEENEDGVVLTDGGNLSGSVTIPATITDKGQTYRVIAIGEGAFKGNTAITSVVISEGIIQIGASAFEGCTNLTEIVIGKDVAAIGEKAFANIIPSANAPRRAGGVVLTVYCYAVNVPQTAANAFENTPIDKALLLVEDSSLSDYSNVEPWKDFGTIQGFNGGSGINAIWAEGGNAKIYTLDGKLLEKPQKGLNIVRMSNGTTKKIVVSQQ